MEKTIPVEQSYKKIWITIISIFTIFVVFSTPRFDVYGSDAYNQNDLLLIPSEKSERGPFSLLMDVTNVNGTILAVGERGQILYSDSGCITWTQAEVPVSVTLTAVYFPTLQKGWAVGHDGVVLHSKDGGKTWGKQLDGTVINDLMLAQMKDLIRTKTEMLENQGEEMDEARMEDLSIELEDLDFFLSDLEMAVKEGPSRPLMDVWFKNDREGIVVGSFGMILTTSDGGKNWEPILDRMDNPDGFHYYGITRSGDDLFIAGEAGLLFRSEDFGKSWKRLISPYEGSYFGIIGDLDGSFVTAFGLRGNIFYSLDRGETWSASNTGRKASLSGGVFLSDGSFCVAGVDGIILKCPDKGKTFTALPAKFPGSIALTEIKSEILAVVGLRGFKRIDLKQ